MSDKEHRPYGLWPSPLSPNDMAAALRLDGVQFDTDGRRLVWLEGRSGVGVLSTTEGQDAPRDLTTGTSVRARVGYGGGEFTVGHGRCIFVADGRLHRQSVTGGPARPITPAFGQCSSPQLSPDGRWVLFVHSDEGEDVIAVVDAEGRQWPRRLVAGFDFVMWPRWSPGGDAIAYVAWNHPAMPWDETELYLAPVTWVEAVGPVLGEARRVAGGAGVAVAQPEFSPDGRLLAYISDETGWNQLHLYDRQHERARQLTTDEVDHGAAAWIYEEISYAWCPDGAEIISRHDARGFQRLWVVDCESGLERPLHGELGSYTSIKTLAVSPDDGRVAVIASKPAVPPRVLVGDTDTGAARILRRSASETIQPEALSQPELRSWTANDGTTVYGVYYPPTSARYTDSGPAPLVVIVHGGPTSHHRAGFEGQAQFLATRGYGVLAVNYRGSSGHGRAYLQALRGKWGRHDVEDVVTGADHLVEAGLAQADRLVIMGGSAGGFTVLQAMVEHPRFFKAGVCLYGVSNQFALAEDTHKFEARYLDSLLGPLPEASQIYRERSPLFHAERIERPLAVFQGEDDRVVPKNQSDAIVEALRRRGVPHEYHVYPGEGHGWRKAETIAAFYRALDTFLRRHVIYA